MCDAGRVPVTLEGFRDWLEGYFAAWVSNDPDDVAALFAEDAVYWIDPFRDPHRGRDQIVSAWVSEPQEDVAYAYEPLAVTGDVGIAHWNLSAASPGAPGRAEFDGILLIRFASDGRCLEHREWFAHRRL